MLATCRSGARSAKVVEQLRNHGIDAVNLEGGVAAWTAAGEELLRDDGSAGAVA